MDDTQDTPVLAPPLDAVDVVDRPCEEAAAGCGSTAAHIRKVDADFDSFRQQSELVARRRYVTPKDFELIRVIGMGAFGKVLQVRNKESKKVFAMKVISKRVLRKKGLGYIDNILAEQKILSRVGNYPFVVSMHCSFQTAEKLFIIMDFLAGGELFLRLGREGIFLEKTAAFYLAEIILALDYLHASGVLHRDLKPENILLGSDGHVCLTDFGLAKDFGPGGLHDEERANTICGTQEYMAPEMIARKGYGRAADYWSLGCIAYEMLSGLPPFSSKEGSKALFSKIMTEKVKMPSGTTAAGCKLLKGLLNRNVLARFGTARSTMFEVGGVAGLKQQDFFAHLIWDQLERKEVAPPATFAVNDDNDAQYFHDDFTTMTLPRSVVDMSCERFLPRRVQSDAFRGFSFVHDDFLLPPRAEDEVKSYWDGSAEEDGESVSDCASSKIAGDMVLPVIEPPKRKRPQRKRKKNTPALAGNKDAVESRTANTTPLGSAVNSESGTVDYQESMIVAEAEEGLRMLNVSVETEIVKGKPLVSKTFDATVQSFSPPVPAPTPELVANETWHDTGKAKVQSSPKIKCSSSTANTSATKPIVAETWQDTGKKSKQRDKKATTPSTDRARPSARTTQIKQTATAAATAQSFPNSSLPIRHQASPSLLNRGQAAIKQEPVLPLRPSAPVPSGSTDWRQHSMRGSPLTAKPTFAPKLQPEAIVWPSLASDQPKRQATAASVSTAAVPVKPLAGAWAKRAAQR